MSVYLVVEAADDSAASGLCYEKYRIPLSLYPDNSPVLNMAGGLSQIPDLFKMRFLEGMLVNYTTYQDFVAAMDLAYSMNNGGVRMHKLYIPYFPGARQDKPRFMSTEPNEGTGDVLMTLRFTVSLIKMAGFTEVHVLDPHSIAVSDYVLGAGLDLVVHNFIPELDYSKYDGVIAPDAGAVDRAVAVAVPNNLPVFFGQKHRDPVTNKLSGFSVSKLPTHAHYLVVDDICDGGGTFVGLAEEIAKERAKADLFVTHGLFTHGAAERLNRVYNEVFTTDSLGYSADGVTVVPTVNRMFNLPLKREIHIQEGER